MTNAYGEADMTAQNGFQEALCILALIGVVCASREQQARDGRTQIRRRRATWCKATSVWVFALYVGKKERFNVPDESEQHQSLVSTRA